MSFAFDACAVEIAACAGETRPENSTPPAMKPAPAMPPRLRKSARVAPRRLGRLADRAVLIQRLEGDEM